MKTKVPDAFYEVVEIWKKAMGLHSCAEAEYQREPLKKFGRLSSWTLAEILSLNDTTIVWNASKKQQKRQV